MMQHTNILLGGPVALVALLLAASCGGSPGAATVETAAAATSSVAPVPVPVPVPLTTAIRLPKQGEALKAALIRGWPVIDENGCAQLAAGPTKPARNVKVPERIVWPHGYTAQVQADGTLEIKNSKGSVAATSEEQFTAGGGDTWAPDPADPCLAGSPQGFLVSPGFADY